MTDVSKEDKPAVKSETYKYEDGNGIKKSIEIPKWPLSRAGKNAKLFGGILVKARAARPEMEITDLMSNIDILLAEGAEDAVMLIRNSLPISMNEVDKNNLMDELDLADGVNLLGVIIRLNFLSQKMQEALAGFLADPNTVAALTGES